MMMMMMTRIRCFDVELRCMRSRFANNLIITASPDWSSPRPYKQCPCGTRESCLRRQGSHMVISEMFRPVSFVLVSTLRTTPSLGDSTNWQDQRLVQAFPL